MYSKPTKSSKSSKSQSSPVMFSTHSNTMSDCNQPQIMEINCKTSSKMKVHPGGRNAPWYLSSILKKHKNQKKTLKN